jgi:hypothetical protein
VRRDEEEEEVEGHGVGHPRDEGDEVESHGLRSFGRDGQEYELDPSKITTIAWTDDEGEHEVEGQGLHHP